jgi:hypothetical protein
MVSFTQLQASTQVTAAAPPPARTQDALRLEVERLRIEVALSQHDGPVEADDGVEIVGAIATWVVLTALLDRAPGRRRGVISARNRVRPTHHQASTFPPPHRDPALQGLASPDDFAIRERTLKYADGGVYKVRARRPPRPLVPLKR